MNDSKLKATLKGIPVPKRPEEYWNDFPSQVRVEIYRKNRRITTTPGIWWPRLAWGGGLAFALAMAFVCLEYHPLKTASAAITTNQKHLKIQIDQLDEGLHVLMINPKSLDSLTVEPN